MSFDFKSFGSTPTSSPATNSPQPATNGSFNMSQFGQTGLTPPATPPAPSKEYSPTFSSSGNEGLVGGAAKLVGNIPSSSLNFAKNTIDFLNPVKNIKNIGSSAKDYVQGFNQSTNPQDPMGSDVALQTIKEIPKTAYQALTPHFLQDVLKGNWQGARKTLQEDPVNQLAPLLLMARQAAEGLGKGAEFDSMMSTVAKPVTAPLSAMAKGAGNLAAQTLGASTGAGASSIKEAYKGSDSFTEAMRGNVDPEAVVQNVQDAVQKVADKRRQTYQTQLEGIKNNGFTHDLTPIAEQTNKSLTNFGINKAEDGSLNFDNSTFGSAADQKAVASIVKDVADWTKDPGRQNTASLDVLKQRIDNYVTPDTKIGAFANSIKNSVRTELNNAPGYKEMTGNYAKASQLLDNIKSATGAGGNSKVDTVFTKLTTAMRADKDLRLEVLSQLQEGSGNPDLLSQIGGSNMQSFIPKGLIGRGVDVGAVMGTLAHAFNPSIIPALLATSPRIVGEFVRALGLGTQKTTAVLDALNNLPNYATGNKSLPKAVDDLNKNPKLGLSVEDVTTNIHADDLNLMHGFIDSVRIGKDLSEAKFKQVSRLAERFGVSMDLGLSKVANKFEDILLGNKKVKGTNQTGRPFKNEVPPANQAKPSFQMK